MTIDDEKDKKFKNRWINKIDSIFGVGLYEISWIEPIRHGKESRSTLVEVICPVHKKPYITSLRSMSKSPTGCCPECFHERMRNERQLKIPELLARLEEADPTQIYHIEEQPDNTNTNIRITCTKHNITYKRQINNALRPTNKGCIECSNDYKRSLYAHDKDYLIERMNKVHNNAYEYIFPDEYKNNKDKITAICPSHGSFCVSPDNHINKKSRCPLCAHEYEFENLSEEEKNRPYTLYHVLIKKDYMSYEKIGVTGYDVKTRFRDNLNAGYNVETINTLETTRYNAMKKEFDILLELKNRDLRFLVSSEFRELIGWTECFPVGSFDPSPWFMKK